MFASTKDAKLDTAKDGMLNEGVHPIDDAVKAARHFGHDVHAATGAVKDDLEEAARRTGHHIREMADSAGHSLKGAEQALTVKIRENPVQSSLIALGIGLVVGRLFRR